MSEDSVTTGASAGHAAPAGTIPIARSPIAPPEPVVLVDGWEVSGRRANAELTLTDCTPLAKVQLRAPVHGSAAAALGVPFGGAARSASGALVVGSGPGEWLLLGPPGTAAELAAVPDRLAAQSGGELITWVDLTHGRALMRLSGAQAPAVLAKVCGIDLADQVTPDGSALRTAVAALATDIIRDDAGGERSYLLHCERSSGQYLFDSVRQAGLQFGLEINGFTSPGI